MNIMNKLTLRALKLNKRRTIITVIAIMLSVAMVTAIAGFIVSFQDLNTRTIIQSEGGWHVVFRGVNDDHIGKLLGDTGFINGEIEAQEDGSANLKMEFAKKRRAMFDESRELAADLGVGIDFHNTLLRSEGLIENDIFNDVVYQFAGILIFIIIIGSIVVITNAFAISASERKRQFGMLMSIGATRAQVRNSVLFEGFFLACIGVPLGLLLGYAVESIALFLANYLIGDMLNDYSKLRALVSLPSMAFAAVIAFITVFLSAWFPAQKASKSSPIEAIRLSQDIKISKRKVKVWPLTEKIFGFEGVLASKALKRSKGKYRATVISLVVSIVLFISVSSFGDQLTQGTSMVYSELGFSVMTYITSEDADKMAASVKVLSEIPDAKTWELEREAYCVDITEDMLSKSGKDVVFPGDGTVAFISIDDEQFYEFCKEQRIEAEEASFGSWKGGNFSGVLLNKTAAFWQDGKKVEANPFSIKAGDIIQIYDWESVDGKEEVRKKPLAEMNVLASVMEVPSSVLPFVQESYMNVLVPKSIMNEMGAISTNVLVETEDADAFEAAAEPALAKLFSDENGHFYINNFAKAEENSKSMSFLIMLFIYGFIAMLSLIGITSVVSTISTNINLRKQEFAMLRSVGMTEQGFHRMLNLESLFYGIKSLVIGIPLGIIASMLMYRSMSLGFGFAYIWPVSAIIISIVMVMTLTFATMHYAKRKQRKLSIMEGLRMENM